MPSEQRCKRCGGRPDELRHVPHETPPAHWMHEREAHVADCHPFVPVEPERERTETGEHYKEFRRRHITRCTQSGAHDDICLRMAFDAAWDAARGGRGK